MCNIYYYVYVVFREKKDREMIGIAKRLRTKKAAKLLNQENDKRLKEIAAAEYRYVYLYSFVLVLFCSLIVC